MTYLFNEKNFYDNSMLKNVMGPCCLHRIFGLSNSSISLIPLNHSSLTKSAATISVVLCIPSSDDMILILWGRS